MSMLKYFFEYGCDSQLFDRLEIADDRALCEEYMGKFPVISITLKGVNGRTYEGAREMLCFAIGNEALRFPFLAESDKLSEQEKAQYRQLTNVDTGTKQGFLMSDAILANSLHTLCSLLRIRDTSVRRNRKENFCHGILLGLLSHREDWYIRPNEESGEEYSDILIEIEDEAVGIVMEVKYVDTHKNPPSSKMPSANGDLEKGCREALAQIETVGYCDRLRQDGMDTVLRYGVACSGKRCAVRGIWQTS